MYIWAESDNKYFKLITYFIVAKMSISKLSLEYRISSIRPLGVISADCVLRARRQKEQRREFERWILQASRTYHIHSTRGVKMSRGI